LKIQAS